LQTPLYRQGISRIFLYGFKRHIFTTKSPIHTEQTVLHQPTGYLEGIAALLI